MAGRLDTRDSPPIHGVDFTSRPRPSKPFTVATGVVDADLFRLTTVEELRDFAELEAWLLRAGPWVGGFDFPFGLPREAVEDLCWPRAWPELVRHCAGLGRDGFRASLDAYRASRAVGNKYPYRRGDAAAGSHSSIKLVNPPVALMFLEGAPRLAAAGVEIPGIVAGDRARVALEAYPGYAVRRLLHRRARVSYKNDAPGKQTASHHAVRREILRAAARRSTPFGLRLVAPARLARTMIEDGTGDRLDAALCALQAAWAWLRRGAGWGLPACDPLEGWIASVPEQENGDGP